ncbi:MAG: T9SS type A sorting domain-containing protein [Chitinophagales bacterium]|nr:T9SS type A sorting domain-containing protein [Chitinophagales bacterium]
MRNNYKARKIRQLKYLFKKLSKLTVDKGIEKTEIILKIKLLLADVRDAVSRTQVKRMLAPSAVAIAMLTSAQIGNTQNIYFAPEVTNPFGIVSLPEVALPEFVDLDGDGDFDLLVGEYYGAIKYYENTGSASAPQFAAPVVNPFGLDSTGYLPYPSAADIDADGDFDLIFGGGYKTLGLFENIGDANNPQFDTINYLPFGLDSTSYFALPEFVDLDDDGDFDLLVGDYYGVIDYFENIGTSMNPSFGPIQFNPFGLTNALYFAFPDAADIDSDGDLDLLVGEIYGGTRLYENIGSASTPMFGTSIKQPFGIDTTYLAAVPAMVDIDNDGDIDIFIGNYFGDMLFYEQIQCDSINTAVNQAGPVLTADTGLSYQWVDCNTGYSPIPGETNQEFTATVNGDYAVILSNGTCNDTSECITVTSIGIEENTFADPKIYPNPTDGNITIDAKVFNTDVHVKITNVLGESVFSEYFSSENNIRLQFEGNPGFYFVQISNEMGKEFTGRITLY